MRKTMMLAACAAMLTTTAGAIAHAGEGHHGKKHDMFKEHDVNGDGVVTKDEFLSASQKRAEEMFSKMDADGNGSITKEESDAAREKMKEKWKERKEKWKEKKGDKE